MSKHGKTCPFQSANILGNSFCQHHQCFNYRRHRTVSDFGNRQYSAGGSRYIPAEPQSESTVLISFAYERAQVRKLFCIAHDLCCLKRAGPRLSLMLLLADTPGDPGHKS